MASWPCHATSDHSVNPSHTTEVHLKRLQPNRRDFIRTVAIGTVATGSMAALSVCSIGGFDFLHGIASGGPLSDRMIL